MAEFLDILDAFSTQLKVGWVIWMAWGIGQIFWFRYERRPQAARARPSGAGDDPAIHPAWRHT